jgi:phytoene synthase
VQGADSSGVARALTRARARATMHGVDRSIEQSTHVLRTHGKTFAWAHRVLGRTAGDRAARLYHFCRAVDDAVDEAPNETAARQAVAELRTALRDRDTAKPEIADFLRLQGALDIDLAEHLFDGCEQDLGAVRIESVDALMVYAFRVAGVVGLWMSQILDAKEPERAAAFAVDLGLAMQLTNIARDVVEDARRDRIYLPAEWTREPLDPERLLAHDPAQVEAMRLGRERCLAHADRLYRSADRGMVFLPPRARLAILTASRVYEGIGPRTLALEGERVFDRAYVPSLGKCLHTGRALVAWGALTLEGRPSSHDDSLHRGLSGLPGCAVPSGVAV